MLRQERLQPPHRLAVDAEWLAAGCQNAKVWAGAEQRGAELRARVEHMLTIIEQQQHVPIGQVPLQRISRRVQCSAANAERARRLGRNVFGRAHRGKINQPDAIGTLPRLTPTELDGRSSLPHACRAGQRYQPGSAQQIADDLELRCAADQPRKGRGYRRNRPRRSNLFAPLLQPDHN